MALSTSAVAVCCSSASLRLAVRSCTCSNRRTFWMAIAAWSAKVLNRLICLALKGRTSVRRISSTPIDLSSCRSGVPANVRWPAWMASCRPSGYSLSSITRSSTQTVSPSMKHRPATQSRPTGSGGRLMGIGPQWAFISRRPPLSRKMAASSVSQNLAALSTTTSSTGWMSVGEVAITRRMSPVAVCCSRASETSLLRACTSSRRRAFSMAMAAWAAKVCNRPICLSLNGLTSRRRITSTPIASCSRISGVAAIVRWPKRSASDRLIGYSPPGAEMSVTCRVWRSISARPVTQSRVAGMTGRSKGIGP